MNSHGSNGFSTFSLNVSYSDVTVANDIIINVVIINIINLLRTCSEKMSLVGSTITK